MLIGRQDELKSLVSLIGPGQLVTVVGLGGVGKTSLVRHCIREVEHRWCDLAVARDAADVSLALSKVVGTDGDLGSLGGAVLVLDGADHLQDEALVGLASQLAAIEGLSVVATSRQPLGLSPERVMRLGPLSPAHSRALFIERVQALQHGWLPQQEEEEAIKELMARLDHLPLAIELAAARRAVMTSSEMIARLGERFRLLRPVGRSGTARALVDVITTAWEELDEPLQAFLAQCSVFRGGFTLEACSQVVNTDLWHVDALQELVDTSMLWSRAGRAGTRFYLPESVRDFVLPLVADQQALQNRHIAWVVAFLDGRPELGPAFSDERWNMVAVVDALMDSDPSTALQTVLAGARLSSLDGPRFWLDRLNEAASRVPSLSADVLGRLRNRQALLSFQVGEIERVPGLLEEALEVAEPGTSTYAEVFRLRGATAARMGSYEQAEEWLDEGLRSSRQSGDLAREASILVALAGLYRVLDRRDEAYRVAMEAHELYGRVNSRWGQAVAKASAALDAPDPVLRWNGTVEAAQLAEEGGNDFQYTLCNYNLALSALLAADYDSALRHSQLAVARAGARPFHHRASLAVHGGALVGLGQLEEADAVLKRAEGMQIQGRASSRVGLMSERAEWHIARGELPAAERVLRHCVEVTAGIGVTMRLVQVQLAQGLPAAYTPSSEGPFREVEEATQAWAEGTLTAERLEELRQRLGPRESNFWVRETETRRAVACLLDLLEPSQSGGLTVGPDAAWYALEGQEVDLSRRGAQRRILTALAELRQERPGATLDLYDVFEVGWPGDRVGHEQVTSRVYNAVKRLRDSGLREVLQRVGDGYRLDPECAVRLANP